MTNEFSQIVPSLPTPHLAKLMALLRNPRLPAADRPMVGEALNKYKQWITEMSSVMPGQKTAVRILVEALNKYKYFIEYKLIFCSEENFLYRQKGQLKLDNTILEEFLPHLMYRGLKLPKENFVFGPRKTFSGLNFASFLSDLGNGGKATLKSKDQDFILGKKLYLMTSFDEDFKDAEHLETCLGYVCIECKTNLDKTMFQEAVATSRDLKMALPSSLYFLVSEFLDMTPMSITATHIDDVLVLRKTKRMQANIRQEYRTAEDRKKKRDEFRKFLENAKYHNDVFERIISKVQTMADNTDPETGNVLSRGFF